MQFRRITRAVTALAVLLSVAPTAARAADLPGSGGVRVNGRLVSADRVWQEYRFQGSVRGFIHGRPAAQVDPVLFHSVVRQVTGRELLEQEALRLGLRPTDDDRAEARRRQVEAWKGEGNFLTAARMMGVPAEYLVERAVATILRDKMAAAEVPATPPAGEAQLRRYYEEHAASFAVKDPPLRYIFISRRAGVRAVDLFKQVGGEADALRQAGKSFAAVVARYSEDPGAAAGGGVPPGAPGRPRELKAGRFTNFFVDDAGLHMYLRDPEAPAPYDQVRERVARDELAQRRTRWLAGLLERLQGQAKVERLVGPPPPPSGGSPHGGGSGT